MTNLLWLNSKCPSQMWLHDFQILREFPEGLEEYCTRCGMVKLFTHKEPNELYLSYHLRQSLQPFMNNFNIEYGKQR
jgi:hypothetical protein